MRRGLSLVALAVAAGGCSRTVPQGRDTAVVDREAHIWSAVDRNLDRIPQLTGDQIVIEALENRVMISSTAFPGWEISIALEPPYIMETLGSSMVPLVSHSKVKALRVAWNQVRETRWSLLKPLRFKVSEDKRWHNYAFNYLDPYEGSALGVRVDRLTLKPEVMGSW